MSLVQLIFVLSTAQKHGKRTWFSVANVIFLSQLTTNTQVELIGCFHCSFMWWITVNTVAIIVSHCMCWHFFVRVSRCSGFICLPYVVMVSRLAMFFIDLCTTTVIRWGSLHVWKVSFVSLWLKCKIMKHILTRLMEFTSNDKWNW